MGYADRSYSYWYSGGRGGGGNPFAGYALTPWVKRLLIANAALYLLSMVGLLPLGWAARTLGFAPDTFLRQPWTPLTYMFIHGGFWHLFFNMVGLFFFGPPLERTWGGREFLRFYLVAGLGAALFSFLLLPLLGSPRVIGASGAIFGLMLAFALRWPDAPLYIWGLLPIKAKWFVGILAAFSFYATWTSARVGGGNVAHWTHLGGFLSAWMYLRWGDRALAAFERLRARASRAGGQARGNSRERPERAPGRRREPRRSRGEGDALDEVDRILDKIRADGIDSLTAREREFLDEMSRKYRGAG